MRQPVVVLEDKKYGLVRRNIYGLNIFTSNHVDVNKFEDPRVVLLQTICAERDSSAHTGNLFDFADTPKDFFGPADEANYVTVLVGIYSANFYDVSSWPNFPACYFININDTFWNMGENTDFNVLDILDRDALAFYVGCESDTYSKMKPLFHKPFVSHEQWIIDVADIYKIVIISGSDGLDFEVYAKKVEHFEMLAGAIADATKKIESNQWYLDNASHLEWDEKYNMCLMRKEVA